MHSFFVVATLFAFAAAERFTVLVGKDGGLTYDPPSVTAVAGDTVAFQFTSKNHTVTQSTFANPCSPMTTPTPGIDSGYFPVAANATSFAEWSITLEDTNPLWFYCAQGRHCQAGMVFALNPTAERTFDAFKATAMGAAGASPSGSPTAGGAASGASSASGAPTGSSAAGQGGSNNGALSRTANSVASLLALGLVGGFLM